MKNKRGLTLFVILVFGLISVCLVGCSFSGGNHLPEGTSQPLSSGHPYEIAKEYQRLHENNLGKTIEHYRRALDDPKTADVARFELGMIFYKTGDFEKAIQHLEGLKGSCPDRFLASKILGISHFRLHQYPQALEHLRKAGKLNQEDTEVLYFLGLIYEAENFAEEAKECFRSVIQASSQCCWAGKARDHLGALETGRPGVTISQIEDDEVRNLITTALGQEQYPDAGAIILLDQEKLTIRADMTQTREIHKVIKILNDRGKWRAEADVHYNSLEETVHVGTARTIRPNGTIVNVGKEAMRDLTLWAGFPMYSNAKYKVISMPEVEDGAIIEYKATVRSSCLRFDSYFSDSFGFQDYEPTIVSRYILEVPEGVHFKTHFLHIQPIQPRIERLSRGDAGEGRPASPGSATGQHRTESLLRYTWEMRDVPAIKWERRMPGWVDISPRILVSSFPDWEAFNQWWRDLARNRIEADGAIREKVSELIRGENTPEDKARAIFHYVASEIRYVGLEYGKGGFRPHHAKEVFANKYGDCKDQAILLVAMLREAGVSAYPTLIGTRSGGCGCGMWDLQRSIPMSQFDHCIAAARIGGRDIWLDPTDETCSFGDLPGGDQGREVLVFSDDGVCFRKTPVLPPERNRSINEMEIQIKAKGEITVRGKNAFQGWSERAMRSRLKWRDPRERVDYMKELVSEGCPGAILESCTFSPPDDLGVPLTIEYRVSAPEYAKRAGGLLLFRVPWLSNETDHVAKEERTHPLTWWHTDYEEERISIRIPEGYRVRYMPESFEVDLPYASYKLEYADGEGIIQLKTLKERRVRTVEVDHYPDYKKYEERIAKELDKLIILERVEATGEIALKDRPSTASLR